MLITTATELPRLMVCIGSRNMPAALPPDHDHEARDEGNAAHWLAKQWFDGHPVHVGIQAYNGYVITDEMMDHVGGYLEALDAGQMEIETTFSGIGWEVRGRADHISWRCHPNDQYQTANMLVVDDFKYGHRLVSPVMNWTLMAHAIGWCIRNQATPSEIVLRIHQPRAYHPEGPLREWRLSYVDLMTHYATISQQLGYPSETLRAQLDVCAKCHALAKCPAARLASMNAIDAAEVVFSDELPNDVLASEYELLEYALATIENRRDALKELMTHKISSGSVIDNYVLERRLAQTRWKPGLTGVALSAVTGKALTKDGVVTPAEAKRRGVSDATIASLTERPVIGTKLTRINPDAKARKIFGSPGEAK